MLQNPWIGCALFGFIFSTAVAVPSALAQSTRLAVLGGPGGGEWTAQCPAGQILRGFELRTGDDVDALRPICGIASRADAVASEAPLSTFHGGNGGSPTPVQIRCPIALPAVLGMTVMDEGQDTDIVNAIQLSCGLASSVGQTGQSSSGAAFAGPIYHSSDPVFAHFSASNTNSETCPPGQIAVGAYGRSGVFLDAVGLICGAAPFNPVHRIGRNALTSPAKPRSLCAQAADAKKRNSPIAPQLEAACAASKH